MKKLLNALKRMGGFFKRVFRKKTLVLIKDWAIRLSSFLVLLLSYLAMRLIVSISSNKYCPTTITKIILPPVNKAYNFIVSLNRHSDNTINRVNLIELAIKNMRFKMTRTLITIGGMSVGISAIVFLVSLGYGIEDLVTSRVARLDELKQADVSTQPGSNVKINDETISSFTNLSEVEHALPLITLVGKVNFNNSESDMAVFGVTTEFLKQSAIKTVQGKLFDSNELTNKITEPTVAGISTFVPNFEEKIKDVEYSIPIDEWLGVWESPTEGSKLLGYTKRAEGQQTGTEHWGDAYEDDSNGKVVKYANGEWAGKWIKSKTFMWEQNEKKMDKMLDDSNIQMQLEGYIKETELGVRSVDIIEPPAVLGLSSDVLAEQSESTESSAAQIVQLEDGWVIIEGEGTAAAEVNTKKIDLAAGSKQQAVVNRAMLKILGIPENEAVGKKFNVSFIVTSALLEDDAEKVESTPAEYEIVGVIPQEDTAFFYVPFIDVRSLGVSNYSQIKVVVGDKDKLAAARQKVEAMGYVTTSVVDTVSQINALFSTIRKVLALIGAVALSVAALGMFNTLTVSLLERTREIGLMKAMGMKSNEVQELFLTESMVMGFFGGILGIVLGFAAGKFLGIMLSIVAIAKGVGFVDVSYIPPAFILLILTLSLLVGLVTGIYPSRRATKISALDALRYE